MATYYEQLRDELKLDPVPMGYSGKTSAQVLALLNSPADKFTPPHPFTKPVPQIPSGTLLIWGAKTGVRKSIEDACLNVASPVRAIALACRDALQGSMSLDVSNADVLAMLDALVAGGVMTTQNKADLIALQNVPCSRAEMLWGAGFTVQSDDLARAN